MDVLISYHIEISSPNGEATLRFATEAEAMTEASALRAILSSAHSVVVAKMARQLLTFGDGQGKMPFMQVRGTKIP